MPALAPSIVETHRAADPDQMREPRSSETRENTCSGQSHRRCPGWRRWPRPRISHVDQNYRRAETYAAANPAHLGAGRDRAGAGVAVAWHPDAPPLRRDMKCHEPATHWFVGAPWVLGCSLACGISRHVGRDNPVERPESRPIRGRRSPDLRGRYRTMQHSLAFNDSLHSR